MMQAPHTRYRHDSGRIGLPPLEHTPGGRIFVQGVMDAIFVVVVEVLSNEPPQMGFAQHDHVVQQLPATAANPALRQAVLPGTAVGRSNQIATETFQHPRYVSAESAITIKKQVLGCAILWEGFSQLLHDPLTGGMLRGIEVQDSPPTVAYHEKAVKDPEGRRGHSKEIHRGNYFAMVLEKG
jgi:hypothetical protein